MKRWRTDAPVRGCGIATAFALLIAFGAVGLPIASAQAETAHPIEPALSPAKLAPIGDYLRHEIATGQLPGAIMLIQQHGKPIYSECFGVRDVVSRHPMTPDTIFRLYSMSKPITSVAVMMLVEAGTLSLHDPLPNFIPPFPTLQVGVDQFANTA